MEMTKAVKILYNTNIIIHKLIWVYCFIIYAKGYNILPHTRVISCRKCIIFFVFNRSYTIFIRHNQGIIFSLYNL